METAGGHLIASSSASIVRMKVFPERDGNFNEVFHGTYHTPTRPNEGLP